MVKREKEKAWKMLVCDEIEREYENRSYRN